MFRFIAVILSIVVVTSTVLNIYMLAPISSTVLIEDIPNFSEYKYSFEELVGTIENFEETATQNHTVSDQRSKIVQIAMGEVGTMEEPAGSNNIKYNHWYTAEHPGIGTRPHYCAIFTMWCLKENGMYVKGSRTSPAVDSASCDTLGDTYIQNKRFMYAWSEYEPRPGDIILFSWKRVKANTLSGFDLSHAGIVTEYDGEYVYTVEGNTSGIKGVDRNGDGVFAKKYKVGPGIKGDVIGYGIPWYSGDENFKSEDCMKVDSY